jgi:hypothetical protein
MLALLFAGGSRSCTCRVGPTFAVELCIVLRRRAEDVNDSLTLLVSVLVWAYLTLRPWWSGPVLSFDQQQDSHMKGGIFLKMKYMLGSTFLWL